MRGGGKKKVADEAPVVTGWLPSWATIAVGICLAIYLVALITSQFPGNRLSRALPMVVQHFVEAPRLFPDAAPAVIDYRLESWSCADKKWVEVDPRPYFPMRPDDKENRFQRLAQFYHSSAKVLGAFDDWWDAKTGAGGIRLYSLRLPVPPVGQIEPWTRRPLTELPDGVKKLWYQTTQALTQKRCGS